MTNKNNTLNRMLTGPINLPKPKIKKRFSNVVSGFKSNRLIQQLFIAINIGRFILFAIIIVIIPSFPLI